LDYLSIALNLGVSFRLVSTDSEHHPVKMRLVSDVPVGVFLSGGIDSSVVAALAVQANAGTVKTFNLSFEEVEYDESVYAHQVAQALGTEHLEVQLSQAQFFAQLESALVVCQFSICG
jgi:asparagine synthase (glutamine-hydrolysing)